MARFLVCYAPLIMAVALLTTCNAATYMVGDNSGWDISSNLDTWPVGKTFHVGDILAFQYSSNSDVCELKRQDFDTCNTTNPIKTYTNGNTSVPLTRPGEFYFADSNKLYCLGGMKLKVDVENNQLSSPTSAPEAQPGSTVPDPSKNNNGFPTSAGFSFRERRDHNLGFLIGSMAIILMVLWID